MKVDLLDILVCPECKNELNPEVFAKEADGEIVDGLLICRQPQHWYAVVSGIPRMFAGSYKAVEGGRVKP